MKRPVTGSRASDPDPEVPAKVERRRFPPAYRLRIIKEVDACKRPGEVGALLRLMTLSFMLWLAQDHPSSGVAGTGPGVEGAAR